MNILKGCIFNKGLDIDPIISVPPGKGDMPQLDITPCPFTVALNGTLGRRVTGHMQLPAWFHEVRLVCLDINCKTVTVEKKIRVYFLSGYEKKQSAHYRNVTYKSASLYM